MVTPERTQVATLPPASQQVVAPTRHRKIALLLPLSGPRARIGRELLDAAQIALFDLAGEEIAIFPLDTNGTPEGAAAAATEAVNAGVELIWVHSWPARYKPCGRSRRGLVFPLSHFRIPAPLRETGFISSASCPVSRSKP